MNRFVVTLALVIMVAVAWRLFPREQRGKAPEPAAGAERSSSPGKDVSGPEPRPAAVPRAPGEPDENDSAETDTAERVYFPGQGWATVTDPDPDEVPPGLDEIPTAEPLEPPPDSEPVTADWTLGKSERLHELLSKRRERLQGLMAGAADEAERRRLQILLMRTDRRLETLTQDIEALRRDVAREASRDAAAQGTDTGHASDRSAGDLLPGNPGSNP